MTVFRMSLLATTVLFAGLSMPTLAIAQTAPAAAEDDSGIAEIIVTAQRREENLQDVPISVSAFGAEQIKDKGLNDVSRLEGLVPGFTFGRSGVDARPAIRGVRTESVDVNADTTIGFFIDGVYQSRASQATLGFVDLERVEVQRGPQGTLYGRNTFGGNISIVTAQPDLKGYSGGGDLTIGKNNQVRITGFANVPLNDKLGLRVAGAYEKSNGYVKNINPVGGNLFDEDSRYLRASLLAKPNDDLTIALKFDYSKRGGNGGSAFGYKLVGSYFNVPNNAQLFNATPIILNTRAGNRDGIIDAPLTIDAGIPIFAANDPYRINNDFPGSLALKNYSGTSNIAYDVGPVTLKSITGITDFKTTRIQDTDFSSSQIGADYQFTSAKTFTQELQLLSNGKGPLEYVVGAYYFKDKLNGTFINQQFVQIVPGDTRPAAVRQAGGFYSELRAKTQSLAGYAQASYAVTEKIKLTAGVRYTEDKKDFQFANAAAVLPFTAGAAGATGSVNANLITLRTGGIPNSAFGVRGAPTNCTFAASATVPAARPGFACLPADTRIFTGATFDTTRFKKVTFRGGVDYQVTDDSLLYASVSTGFNSGGFNGNQTALASGNGTFDSQTVTAFEIGSKNRFADNRIQLNLSAFYNKYKKLQEQRQIPVGSTTASIIENSGEARSYGAEVEAIFKPVEALTLNASFAYLNAKYTQYRDAPVPFGAFVAPTGLIAIAAAPVGSPAIPSASAALPANLLLPVGLNCRVVSTVAAGGNISPVIGCNFSGNRIAYSPEYSGSVSAQYDIDLGGDRKLSPYAQLNFSGAFFGQPVNSILDRQKAFAKLDLRLTLELNENLSIQGFVTNVTNKASATRFVYGGGGNLQASYAPPRLWGARASVKF